MAKTYVISNSGPVRYVAPVSLASMIDCNIREWFPSKSKAHWLSVDTATVTFRPILFVVAARQNIKYIISFGCNYTKLEKWISFVEMREEKKSQINFAPIQFYLWNSQWRIFPVYGKLNNRQNYVVSKNWMASKQAFHHSNKLYQWNWKLDRVVSLHNCNIEFLAVTKDYRLIKETVAIVMHMNRHRRIYT